MKKLDNRGFTLVELLAVMIILIIITAIAVPNISSSLERTNARQREAKEQLVISGAELYLSDHKSYRTKFYDGSCYIEVSTLVSGGYVSNDDTKYKNQNIGNIVYYDINSNSFEVIDDVSGTASICS